MVDFGESKKMIKIRGKMDESDTYNRFSRNISFFIQEFLLIKHFLSLSTFKQLKKYEVHTISFQTFPIWALLLIVHT